MGRGGGREKVAGRREGKGGRAAVAGRRRQHVADRVGWGGEPERGGYEAWEGCEASMSMHLLS